MNIPDINPILKCKLRLLKLQKVKDFILIEKEFVTNMEYLKNNSEGVKEEITDSD